MIPKIIHYCWFGNNPLPPSAEKCIESWKKFCPDYEIKRWDESNYDITKNQYMYEAYQCKKWGFVPDYARLDIIYDHGGIYLDTDVEIIKPFDELLDCVAFGGVEQESPYVALGLGFGAEKGNDIIRQLRDKYDELHFMEDGQMNLTPAPKINTAVLANLGYKFQDGVHACREMTVFPSEYFCPQNFLTGEITITEKTYSIHHYDSSWYSEAERYAYQLKRKFSKVLPRKAASVLATAVAKTKYDGLGACFKWIFKKRNRRA